ncbi:hypothetical protein ACLOJK_039486 [Asimina triloba]
MISSAPPHCSAAAYRSAHHDHQFPPPSQHPTPQYGRGLGALPNLVHLVLGKNKLIGEIPPSLGNLSSLKELALSDNHLQGSIPYELGQLSNLTFFQISGNNLSGEIPPPIYNLSAIFFFSVVENQLQGSFPSDLGLTLPNLQFFLAGLNKFTGPIPASIGNASALQRITLSNNSLSGPVPPTIGNLKLLTRLVLGRNRLGSVGTNDLDFITPLNNCSNLQVLALSQNRFTGVLPASLANLSTSLQFLLFGANKISGRIPPGIGNLAKLIQLAMEENFFSGVIPNSIAKIGGLQQLSLFGNRFSGQIPHSIGNTTPLMEVSLQNNRLTGPIPKSIGDLRHLQILGLGNNRLTGTIPKEVVSLFSLSIYLDLAGNALFGPLPAEVGNLVNVQFLDVSENRLSGEIPSALGSCLGLEQLYLDGNFFGGSIPPSLSSLRGLQAMGLSRNNLTGHIPRYLEKFQFLQKLNLSFNNFSGEVPKGGVFQNRSAFSVLGNDQLCGGIPDLHLPDCHIPFSKKRPSAALRIILPVVSSVLFMILLLSLIAAFCWRRKSSKKQTSTSKDGYLKVTYKDLLRATDGFSSANLLGVGSYGSVYKGILDTDDGLVVAVKVFDLQRRGSLKSFMAECEALRNIRHRNLVKIVTSCSSMDMKGDEFKALVFEFMPNGSLEDWLYGLRTRCLNLVQRLNIAIDVASALEYLHHHCQTPIVHCDLKPSNVLLDDDMCAHVGDFGLARLLSEHPPPENQTSSAVIKGSIGYVAPEYGVGDEVSTQGDVYSYGILLLEMFTGKRPVDEMFKDGLTLHAYVKMALPETLLEVVDDPLITEAEQNQEDEETPNSSRGLRSLKTEVMECLTSVFGLALMCSAESPRERLLMEDVAVKMREIRDRCLGIGIHRGRG